MAHPLVALQGIIPQRLITRFFGALSGIRAPWFKHWQIRRYMRTYGVDLSDSEHQSPDDFETFQHFFTRSLAEGRRPLPEEGIVASPAEGTLSQVGTIDASRFIQAKGLDIATPDFLGDAAFAESLDGGNCFTVYLAPRDYHRVHAPLSGRLRSTLEIPGRLFSVNELTASSIPGLFVCNERLVLRVAAPGGDYALVLVGAFVVASIEVVWSGGPVSPYRERVLRTPSDVTFERGLEIGRFLVGSTVVALFPPGMVEPHPEAVAGNPIRVRAPLARLI